MFVFCVFDRNHPGVLGETSEHLPRIVAVMAEALYKEVFQTSQEVYGKMLAIIAQIKVRILAIIKFQDVVTSQEVYAKMLAIIAQIKVRILAIIKFQDVAIIAQIRVKSVCQDVAK